MITELSEFYGPDGELGTDADWLEDILAAREDAAEYACIMAELECEL